MENDAPPARLVIKRVARKTGTLPAAKLAAVVRAARESVSVKPVKALRRQDTATGSGRVKFKVDDKPTGRRARSSG